MDLALTFYDDAARFLADAEAFLAAEPIITTVVSTVARRAADGTSPGQVEGSPDPWWLVVTERSTLRVVGAGMCTMGMPPYLLPMPDGAGTLVGEALLARGEEVPGANGVIGPVTELCAVVARSTGRAAVTDTALRLHRLVELTAPEEVAGRGRPATAGDADLLATWRMAFHEEAHSGTGALEENAEQAAEAVRRSIAHRTTWVWEDAAGQVVCYVGANPPAYGVARVGPVYTPPVHRRHGYAAACTALASAALRETGADEVCLFTDLANPTSNGVYYRIGYLPVTDMANLRLV